MSETAKNHTDRIPSIAIKCQGYKDEKGKTVYAEGHTVVRLVHAQDVKQTTRCAACQKAHTAIAQKAAAMRRRVRKQATKAIEEAKTAKQTLKDCGADLTESQKAQLQLVIDSAK